MRASAIARFTATVVLATPPLPLATAISVFTPGIGILSGCPIGLGGVGGIYPHHRRRLKRGQATAFRPNLADSSSNWESCAAFLTSRLSEIDHPVIRFIAPCETHSYNHLFMVFVRI